MFQTHNNYVLRFVETLVVEMIVKPVHETCLTRFPVSDCLVCYMISSWRVACALVPLRFLSRSGASLLDAVVRAWLFGV